MNKYDIIIFVLSVALMILSQYVLKLQKSNQLYLKKMGEYASNMLHLKNELEALYNVSSKKISELIVQEENLRNEIKRLNADKQEGKRKARKK